MSDLYLVRHGQGSFGSANYDKLSELGCEQSKLLGEHFAGIGAKIDCIYAGTLQRQHETAELLAEAYAGPGGAPLPIAWGTNAAFTSAQTLVGFPTGTTAGAYKVTLSTDESAWDITVNDSIDGGGRVWS